MKLLPSLANTARRDTKNERGKIGSITFGPSSAEDAMAASIVHLLERLAEVEAERDFYKAAAGKLMKPQRRRKQ
jgi:hypothetical protein